MTPIEITAHRGSSAKAPENTLTAMRQAVAEGCDYIELDVQTCADGTVVVIHDSDLLRVAGDPRRVESLTVAELKQINVGRQFSTHFTNEFVPTLAEVISLASGQVRLNIELKYHRPDPSLVPRVLALLREAQFLDQCVITSVETGGLRECKASAPGVRTGWIITDAIEDTSEVEVDVLSVAAPAITTAFVSRVHRAGKQVHAWTVNEPEGMLQMIESGVDNIITDTPDVLRAILEKPFSRSPP